MVRSLEIAEPELAVEEHKTVYMGGGAMAGAAAGAAIGTAVAGPVGTFVGTLGGAVAGALSGAAVGALSPGEADEGDQSLDPALRENAGRPTPPG